MTTLKTRFSYLGGKQGVPRDFHTVSAPGNCLKVHVVRHLDTFQGEGLRSALEDVLAFDSYNEDALKALLRSHAPPILLNPSWAAFRFSPTGGSQSPVKSL